MDELLVPFQHRNRHKSNEEIKQCPPIITPRTLLHADKYQLARLVFLIFSIRVTPRINNMAISHDPPSVLIGPGDFHTGPYYIIISGVSVLLSHNLLSLNLQASQLPERTSWQDVKDFIKSQIPWKLDIYVSIFGKRQDSGWVRVIGFKAFNHVRSMYFQAQKQSMPMLLLTSSF